MINNVNYAVNEDNFILTVEQICAAYDNNLYKL